MKRKTIKGRLIALSFIICHLLFSTLLASCDDWLDVRSETEAKEKEMFSSKAGFKDALTGIYLTMGSRDAYGEKLTMSAVEELANLWHMPDFERVYEDSRWLYFLNQHDYENAYAQDAIKAMYGKLYNVAVQSNLLLKNLSEGGDAIDDRQLRNVIEGEAHALRAYAHLDVLRLFGQLPQGGSIGVRLPYCETTSIDDIPEYYDFNAYVAKLEADLNEAVSLLEQSDPVLDYQLSANNTSVDQDSYLLYRRYRLNYWAVKALQARLYLYIGQTQKAHDLALEVINAKGREDGESIAALSGITDLNNSRYALPGECLFALAKYDLLDYSNTLLLGGSTRQAVAVNQYVPLTLAVTAARFSELFAGVEVASDNRYNQQWNTNAVDNQHNNFCTTKKYWYDTTDSNIKNPSLYNLIIPMLRMSELYLTAIETTTSLAEANELWDTYQRSHNVLLTDDAFTQLSEVKPAVQAEFMREFYAEGQMFYYYKRTGASQMKWRVPAVEEKEYILPLPETEYEPGK